MDFRMTDEQELLLESIREFCSRHIDEQKIQEWYANHGMPSDVTKAWIDAGFGFMGIPEEYGGTPTDLVTLGLMIEEVSRCTGASIPFTSNTLAMFDICEFGNDEQIAMAMDVYKETGQSIFSLAISEPGAGSDNMAMTTTAREIDGKIHLNGTKTWVTNGENLPYVLAVAKDEDPDPKNPNMSMWLFPLDTPGVSTAPLHKIGNQINPFCEMYFDDVILDKSCLVGERGKGFMNLMKNFEMERCVIVAGNLGLAQAAMEDAAAYATQRVAFGQTISRYQLIQEKLTDMEIKLQTTRNFLYKTLWELENGVSVQLNSALLKRYGAHVTTEVCNDAMQIFGGLGYTTETRVGRCMLDCRGMEFGGGTNEIMVYIAGRQIAKKYAK